MKIFIEIIDTKSFIYQTGMIDEPVEKGLEVQNALGHFGVNYGNINWETKTNLNMFGRIIDTTKIVSVITPENIAPKNIISENII